MTTHSNGFDVIGAIEAKWLAKGGAGGFLGQPLGNEQPADNGIDSHGRTQRFAGGLIAWHPDINVAYEVHGAIRVRWEELQSVRFGFPITDETTPPDTEGRFNHFRAVHLAGKPDSSIYWHNETGAHEVYGAIRDKWASLGWESSVVGYPTGAEEVALIRDVIIHGALQPFQRGFITWHPSLGQGREGAHEVHGAIAARWDALGRTDFGFPTTDELTPMELVGIFELPSRGRYNHFGQITPRLFLGQRCSIYWHPDVDGGAHEVCGPIRDKWASMGWERSVVGYPTGPREDAHGGTLQPFQRGYIAHYPVPGPADNPAHEVHGAIATRWNELGRADFGYPITDEQSTPGETFLGTTVPGIGRYNHFRAWHLAGTPESSIYWHPDVAGGAHEIYGAIRAKWASLGWERSKLGYPTTGERDRAGAGRTQDFQNGTIAWVSDPGAWVDWFRVRRLITTPSGSALGGWTDLEVHQNGHTFFRGYLRNSSDIVDYKFMIRATLDVPPGAAGFLGQSFLFQKRGEVENAVEWLDVDYHETLRENWGEVERANVGIAKSYEKTGLIDDIGGLMLDSITFVIFSATLGGHIATALLVTKGLSSLTKTPIGGLGGNFGILAVAGTTLLMGPTFAIPVFIGAAVVTALLYKQRELSAEEYEFAKVVFGDTLPPRENIILTNMSGEGGRGFAMPAMDGHSMLINIGDRAFNYPTGPMRYPSDPLEDKSYPRPGQLLIHELVHAWQFSRMSRFVPGYICRGAGVQIGNYLFDSSYVPPKAGSRWGSDFGLEQEAATVDQWFRTYAVKPSTGASWSTLDELREGLNHLNARQDPYFRYIENNIRLGEDDHD